jgi:hypothetical protein
MIVQDCETLPVPCRLETGSCVSTNHARAACRHYSCRKHGCSRRNEDYVLESRADAAGELCHRRNDGRILHSIQHAPMNCPSAAREHASWQKHARRLRIGFVCEGIA